MGPVAFAPADRAAASLTVGFKKGRAEEGATFAEEEVAFALDAAAPPFTTLDTSVE